MSKGRLLRVTQMNAIFLDNEIYKSLTQLVQDLSKFLPPGFVAPFEPEIGLILRMVLLKKSVYKSGSTFGQQLLSIKYANISTFRRALYLMGTALEYLKSRVELWNPSHKLNDTIFKVHMWIVLLNFINTSIFLRNGVKPLLIERILGLSQDFATENAPRHFDSKYLARELLWSGFIEILLYILPLINYHKIKRTIRNYNPLHNKPTYVALNARTMTMHSKCAHCGETPILPHHMGCAHIFCYVCLKGNQTADSKYKCPICEHRNPNVMCDRVTVV